MDPKMLEILQRIEGATGDVRKEQGDQRKLLASFEERLKGVEEKTKAARGVSLPGCNEGKEMGFSFQRAILAISEKNPALAPREWDIMREAGKVQARALSSDVDSAGGFIVPMQFMPDLIELLRAKTVVREMGCTMLDNLTGSPVQVPKQTGGATGYWVGEGSSVTASDQTIGQVTLSPKEAAAMTKIQNKLLRLSNPSAEGMVRRDLALVLARTVDLAALRGSGSSNQPLGVVNQPSINSRSIAAVPTLDDLWNMVFDVESDNADLGSLGWVMAPRTWNTLRQLKDGNGRYYLQPDPTLPNKGTLLGYPYRTTTQLPITLGATSDRSELIFGNWQDLVMAQWGGIEIKASQETSDAFEKDQTWVKILMSVDFGLRHAESFCVDATIKA